MFSSSNRLTEEFPQAPLHHCLHHGRNQLTERHINKLPVITFGQFIELAETISNHSNDNLGASL